MAPSSPLSLQSWKKLASSWPGYRSPAADPEHGAEGCQPAGLHASVMDGEGLSEGDRARHAGWAVNSAMLLVSPVLELGKGCGDIGGGLHVWAPAHPVTCKRAVLVWIPA